MVIKIRKMHAFLAALLVFTVCLAAAISTDSINVSNHIDKNSVRLTVIMYHQITVKPERAGKYVVTAQQFENDIKYLTENGYKAINTEELLRYVNTGEGLPEKPVMISFDDGFETIYTHVLPILEKYKQKVIIGVIGSETDKFSESGDHNTSYSCLNWDEIKELSSKGYAEIQNHSYDLHSKTKGRYGSKKKFNESLDEYKEIFSQDTKKMQEKIKDITGSAPKAYIYPYGAHTKDSIAILKEMGIECAFTCEEKINYLDREHTEWLFRIGRYNRNNSKSSADFFGGIL